MRNKSQKHSNAYTKTPKFSDAQVKVQNSSNIETQSQEPQTGQEKPEKLSIWHNTTALPINSLSHNKTVSSGNLVAYNKTTDSKLFNGLARTFHQPKQHNKTVESFAQSTAGIAIKADLDGIDEEFDMAKINKIFNAIPFAQYDIQNLSINANSK